VQHNIVKHNHRGCPAAYCGLLQVVDKYDPSKAISTWPKDKSTDFALQYGKKDDLAPPELSLDLAQELRDAGLSLKVSTAPTLRLGTR
jgi:proteasome lid subunit RPN8/RPN11